MPTLAEFRQQTGDAYNDMSDQQLGDAIYKKYYSDMPRADFDQKVGLAAAPGAMQGPPDERSFVDKATSKIGSFLHNVYENPPPSVAGVRDIIKGAPQAAQELTWGADPQAAEQAAGTMLGAAGLGVTGSRALQFPARAPAGAAAEAAPTATSGALEAAGRLGVGVPKFLATEGTAVPQLAAGMKNAPWAGEPIVRAAQQVTEDLGRAKGGIAPAAATPELAGEGASRGIASWVKTGSQEPVGAAYRTVDELIDPSVRVPLDHTREMVGQIMAERSAGRIPGRSKAVDTVFQAMQDPTGMDYAGTKTLRSFLGEKTPQELAVSGMSPVETKRLYGALTRDLSNAVRTAGGEEALSAWQEANALARLTNMQREALSKVVGREGLNSPEAVFSKLVSYAGSKSTADLKRLQLARRAMGPEAWNEVGSALIDRLGKAPDGTFSPDRFVTAFGNMSPRGRAEMFTPQQHAALMDLFTVSQFVRDRITRFGNPSGTSRGMFGTGIGAAMFGDPVSTLAGLVGTRMVASALSRPAVVRAAADLGRAQMTRNPVMTQRALQNLYQVAAREGLISATRPQQQGQPQFFQQQLPPGLTEEEVQRALNTPRWQPRADVNNYPDMPRINPAAWEAFLANAPRSRNIEDRRRQ